MRTKIEEREYIKWPVKKRMLDETKGRCAHCGAILKKGGNLTLEHFIPLNKGGRNEEENFTVLCYDCNQLKSDMILPVGWYPYLPKEKRNVFRSLIRKYMTEVDYLAEDCVMRLDTFHIRAFVPIQKKLRNGRYQRLNQPITIEMLKMTWYDAFDWLMEYKMTLDLNDSYGTISEPREWRAPCYMLKKGDKEIAMVNPQIIHKWEEKINNYHNEIVFDWYFSPALSDQPYITDLLAGIMEAVEYNVMNDLSATTDGTAAILVTFRCFASDRFCEPVFDRLNRSVTTVECPTKYHIPAKIITAATVRVAGEKKAADKLFAKIKDEAKESKEFDEYMKVVMKYSEPFNKRFETAHAEEQAKC